MQLTKFLFHKILCMNLVIDIGNTSVKMALFECNKIIASQRLEKIDVNIIQDFCDKNLSVSHVIISAVKDYPKEINTFLEKNYTFSLFTHQLPIPLTNKYLSPETLGKDRLAAAIGANALFPNQNVLVIDAGTALKFDFVNKYNEYLGGAISPGIQIRYKALHSFTGKLPLLNSTINAELIGTTTQSSMESGVLNGILAEVEGIVEQYNQKYTDLQIVLTGGDHNYFDKRLKIKTFVAPNIVLEGLNLILNYNIEKY